MKRTVLVLLPLLAFLLLHGTVLAQIGGSDTTVEPDERISKLLDELGLKYEVSSTGNYKLTFDVGEGRSQMLIINSSTEKLDNMEIREVWSPAYQGRGALSKEVANAMLENSFNQKIGAWQVMPVGDDRMATYAAKIAASTDSRTLMIIIRAVVTAADNMEQQVSKGDKF